MLVIYISIMIFSAILFAVCFSRQSDCITVLSMVAFMISSILAAVEFEALKNKIEEAKGYDDNAEPVVYGWWISRYDEIFPADSSMECSVCGEEESFYLSNDNYCPNCGAIMSRSKNDAALIGPEVMPPGE